MSRLLVIGAGAWGTALAQHLAAAHETSLWGRREALVLTLRATRRSPYLPQIDLSPALTFTTDLQVALSAAQATILAVPTQALRAVLRHTSADIWPTGPIVIASKGLEVGSMQRASQIVGDELGTEAQARTVVLSGPSFALETALGHPTALVAAARVSALATIVQQAFSHANVRVYSSDDPLGVELAGASKNVVAIAAGVMDGLGFGSNGIAALVTRALAEMTRLGTALGARRETFVGLAGLGDLVLTCTGSLSRNRQVGQAVGRGQRLDDLLAGMVQVAEGVESCRAIHALARQHDVDMPIVAQVHAILFAQKEPRAALAELLSRPLRAEPEESAT